METIKSVFEPLTRGLPQDAKDFLDNGGWWLVLGVLALLALLFLYLLFRLLGRIFFPRRPPPPTDWDEQLRIHLAECPLPVRPPGDMRLTAFHQPVRIRLIVLAAPGKEHQVDATAVEKLLERIVPGLGAVAYADRPRIRVWPAQLSYQGFANTFHRVTVKDEPEDEPSRWVLLAGRAQVGRQPVCLGLGLWADQPQVIGRRVLEPTDWLGVLRVEKAGG